MNATEKLIDRDLNELLGGETPPDLIAATLQRIGARSGSQSERGEAGEGPAAERRNESVVAAGDRRSLTLRAPMLIRLATAACVALAVGLITWVLWPQPLPETVTASVGANYLVRDDHIQLNQGWLLLTDGAPQVRTDSGRVSVTGRAVAGPAIPGDDALDALADQLGLSAEERVMFKLKERWLTAASLAICLFSGQAMFNGEVVVAQDLPQPEVKVEKVELPDRDDLEGLRALIRKATDVRVRAYVDGTDQWSGTLTLEDTATALATIADGLGDRLEGEPENEIENYIELQLSSDDVMSCTLDANGNLFRVSGPGWEGDEWYRIDAAASATISWWIDRAKGIPVGAESAFRVLRKWEGNDSEITEARCEVIADKDAWSALWMAHTINPMDDPVNPPKLPDVDFEHELVVAVFGGSSVNSRGYFVQEILNARNGWSIRVDETTYQTVNGADKVTPYGIWVFPKDGGSIVVEENVQTLKNEGPLWKSIGARLGTDELRDDTKDYLPTHTITRKGGPEVKGTEYQVIRSLNEWQAALARINDDSAKWPDPDFSDSIAIAAFGSALNGRGNFVLDVWGFTPSSLHLRLIAPVAQGEGNPKYEPIFGVWVLKRHALDIVIETPKYGRIGEPARWQTTLTAKQKDEAFGIYDDVYGSGLEEFPATVSLANSKREWDEIGELPDDDWVDWTTESLLVIHTGAMRVNAGITATVSEKDGNHVITYQLSAPSGVDPGVRNQMLMLKIRKPTKTLIIKQELKAGPGPAEVKEVARFER